MRPDGIAHQIEQAGDGWTAVAEFGRILLHCHWDALDQALDGLLPPSQRRWWRMTFMHVSDLTGWDVYRLERVGQGALDEIFGGSVASA